MTVRTLNSDTKNCKCKNQPKVSAPQQRLSFALSLLIALLPKCPFCIFGYTSVMAMCSGASVSSHKAGNAVAYLPMVFAALVIGSLLWNFKGQKTIWALVLAFVGAGLVNWSALWSGNLIAYFSGAFLIFISIFINGSFAFFWNKIKEYFKFNSVIN
jgi:hypothetical protein